MFQRKKKQIEHHVGDRSWDLPCSLGKAETAVDDPGVCGGIISPERKKQLDFVGGRPQALQVTVA